MNKFNARDMEDKMLKICNEILDEKWNSSCNLSCSGIKCENCFFGDTFEDCDNRDTEMFKFLAKSYKDKYSTAINDNNMSKELTFREVITQIKEDEIWESEYREIFIANSGGFFISNKNGTKSDCYLLPLTEIFKLRRTQYTFEEAFKSYEEGKEIESCETGARFVKSDNKDMLYMPAINRFSSLGRGFNIDEVRGKRHINNK